MLRIDKKKGVTLFVLALLITALLVATMSGPTSAGYAGFLDPNRLYLHGPSLTPIHMHSQLGILTEELMTPIGTPWHELYPEYCEEWVLTSFEDEGDGILGFGDQIDMTNIHTEEVCWYFVDRMTYTLRLYSEFYDETIYVEFKGEYNPYEPYLQPISTLWHEVWPVYHGVTGGPYHIVYWEDTGIDNEGYLGVCDTIGFEQFPEVLWHVEEYATDLILNEKITDPTCTIWDEIYPGCGLNDYHIRKWRDNGDGLLSPSDYIAMTLLPEGPTEDYHVDEVTLTLNLTVSEEDGVPVIPWRLYIEAYYEGEGYTWMYYAKVYPDAFDWITVCPEDGFDYLFWVIDWVDNCNGVLDTCDNITLTDGELDPWILTCHVDEVAVDITVGPACATEDGYKPPFNDYAQSGMPDFDQKQDEWYSIEQWTYCGPTAVANSLWWMDSRFEDPESPPPPTISDSFVMVTRYDMAWDDHDPQNVQPFIEDLAWYMDTDGIRTGSPHAGTNVLDMYDGISQYLTDRGLQNVFEVNMMEMPPFDFVEYEIERCEDVILLLGLWQFQEPGVWVRFGGHYVTAAGVWSDIGAIAFSDPFIDNAEVTGLGRILPPHTYPHGSTVHNNATFVSQDTYYIGEPSPSPGGLWFIPDYYVDPWWNFQGQNDNPFFEPGPYDPMYAVAVEVEFMVTVSPIPCTEVLLGDANGDGFANVVDLGLMSDAWLTQVGDALFDPRVDFNFDGFVNVVDLGILSDQWLKEAQHCP